MTAAAPLDAEIEDARGLLCHIEFALDDGRIDEASLYASELAEVMYRALLLDLAHHTDDSAIASVAGV
ncbi:MAG: hypothetical protein ACOYNZ_07310 [Rhodoferax sp.]